jgi:hypothetical protein
MGEWVVMAIIAINGSNLRVEVAKANDLQGCKTKAMQAYAHLQNGPMFCQHIDRVEMIDVYGNARPIQ